jgi:conjugal transfer pilus assembly protein TrbC
MPLALSRPRLAAIAGFLALAGVSAALAQSVTTSLDGLDLKAVKARSEAEITEAQVFVDTVIDRGKAHEAEAEALREEGLAAVRGLDPASLPKGPDGAVDFDAMLAGAAANSAAPMGEGPLFVVFASLSMPKASLSALIADTTRAGGMVVFRGFPGNSAKAFAEGLRQVVSEEAQEAHIAIDPRLFRAFRVSAAPTFVVTARDYELCDGLDCTSITPEHDRMTGNVTVGYALERFAASAGPGAGVARVALARLERRD